MCTRAGSNVNATKIHRTPLHIVCDLHADRPHLALLLLAYGARADVRNNNGCTPLDLLLKNWEHGLPVRWAHYRSLGIAFADDIAGVHTASVSVEHVGLSPAQPGVVATTVRRPMSANTVACTPTRHAADAHCQRPDARYNRVLQHMCN